MIAEPIAPCAGSHIEARRVRPIGRRSRSGHWNQTKRVAPPQVQGGMAQTSRDSPAAVIPQAVTPRTRRAGRSGTHKAHARGGAGAGEPPHIRWECAGIQSEATHQAVLVWRGFSLNPVADKQCPNLSPLLQVPDIADSHHFDGIGYVRYLASGGLVCFRVPDGRRCTHISGGRWSR